MYHYYDINAALSDLSYIFQDGRTASTITVRGSETKELLFQPFIISSPQQRFIIDKRRKSNPFAQIAEALWALSGRNDLDWLEKYIPQCKKFSDDGETWRAGYGPRLRNWDTYDGIDHVADNIDQVAEVIKKLEADPFTRQAVISIWDPASDWIKDSKDYPCNNWLHFIQRNGELHLNVSVRSNDLIWGFSHADFFAWSTLQELIADILKLKVGSMLWNATSMHIYPRHYNLVESIADKRLFPLYPKAVSKEFDVVSLHEFDSACDLIFEILKGSAEDESLQILHDISSLMFDYAVVLLMYDAYIVYRNASTDDIKSNALSNIGRLFLVLPSHTDVTLTCLSWLHIRMPELCNYMIMNTDMVEFISDVNAH